MDYAKTFYFKWWIVKLFVGVFCLLETGYAMAYTHTASFQVDNIWYTRIPDHQEVTVDFTGTLSVAGFTHGCYSGDIVIPSTVEYNGTIYTVVGIAQRAFYYCLVNSLTLPSTIRTIDFEAFRGCKITELELPSSLQSLGNSVFAESSLQKLTIPSGIKSLPDYAFRGSAITEIKLPSTLKNIGEECFYESQISKITIPEGVEEIKNGTFYNTPLSEVILPTTLKRIGNKAFQKTKMANLSLQHSNLESIGSEAFRESNLTQISLPTTVVTLGEKAFMNCADLTFVNMNCPQLEAIEKQTFYGCSALEQLSAIPDAVQVIGEEAFYNCTSPLLTVKINESSQLKNIGVRAFKNAGIYALNIPASTQTIGEEAFAYCEKLEKVTFSTNSQLESIGPYAFRYSLLKEALLPNSIHTIGHDAFYSCTSLTKVSIPQNLVTIESQTFYNCKSLQEVLFTEPSQLKSIKDKAFYKCVGLERITLPEGLEDIGERSFCMEYGNEGVLSYVYIPSTVKSIGIYAFSNVNHRDITIDLASPIESVGNCAFQAAEKINIWHYDSWIRLVCNSVGFNVNASTNRIFPHVYLKGKLVTDYVIPDDITSIPDRSFLNNTDMLSVIFPNTLTSIGKSAFGGCTALQSITFGESIQSLGAGSFYGCTSMKETHIADYESWIRLILTGKFSGSEYESTFTWNWFPNVYLNGEPLTDYVIPDEYTNIRKNCFANNRQITSVTLPSSLKAIEESAFADCTALRDVTFITPPETIGSRAFENCSLTTVDIGNLGKWCDVQFLGSYITSGTNKNKIMSNPLCMMTSPKVIVKGRQLETLTIPSNVTSINAYAFLGCQRFDQVTFPNALTCIGDLAFGHCSDLTTLKFGKNPLLETIGGSAFCHTSLYDVQLPNSVKTVGDYAFDSCLGLKKIVMPQVQLIGRYAFSNCTALEDVLLPEGLQKIDRYAFNACSSLKSVHIPTTLQKIEDYAYSKSGITDVYITDLTAWCNVEKGNGSLAISHLYLNESLVKDLIIPSDVTVIQPYSFLQNLDLVSVTVPEGVTSIGQSCFSGCHNLVSVRLPESIEHLGPSAFYSSPSGNGSNLRAYDINLTVADLGSYVKASAGFYFKRKDGFGTNLYLKDQQLSDVIIPEGITSIGRYVFANFNIQSATLPSTLETIDETAFINTPQIKYLYSKSRFAPTCTGNGLVLSNVKAIFVPKGCAERYKGKWGDNAAIIKEAPDEMFLDGEQTAESIQEQKMAYSAVNGVPVTYVDLTEATLDETVTSGTLKEGDANTNTFYFLPSGTTGITGDNIVQDSHAENVVLENGSDMAVPMAFTADMVNLSCSFPASDTEAYTLCLPYSLSTLPEGMKAYTIKETNKNSDIVFAPVTSVEANKPYLITTSNDIDNLCMENVELEATPDEMEDAGNEDFEFRGTLCDISNEDAADMGAYVLTANREWLPVSYDTPERYIKAGSAYLVPITSPKAKVLSLLATEQGEIESIPGDANGDSSIDVTDIVAIANSILGHASESFDAVAADVNGDGSVDVTDIVVTANIILHDGGANAANVRGAMQMLDPQ